MSRELYDLTHPQKRIFQLEQLYSNKGALNIMGYIIFKNKLDIELLKNAMNRCICNNDAIRTIIFKDDLGIVKQYFANYTYEEIEVLNFENKYEEYKEWLENQSQKTLDFYNSKLYRMWILINPKGEIGFSLKFHHIISDAWSIVLSTNQIWDNYKKMSNGEELEEKENSYTNFLYGENKYKETKRFEADRDYWINNFKNYNEVTSLKKREEILDISADRLTHFINKEFYDKITSFCERHNFSIFNFLFANAVLVLSNYTNKNDVSLGTVILNRSNKVERNTLGMFISTLAVRLQFQKDISYIEFIGIVRSELMKGIRHQKYPYDLLTNELRDKFNVENKLYDVVMSYQNASFFESSSEEDEYYSEWVFNKNSFDTLTIHVNDRSNNKELMIDYDYQVAQLDSYDINRFHELFINTINSGIDEYETAVSQINNISEVEKYKLLHEFNNNSTTIPKKSISKLFEEQVLKCKNEIAIIDGDNYYTYDELNKKANKLASYLIHKGIGTGTNIPIIMNRSYEFIVSVIAILKSGATYVPVDNGLPKDRVKYILEHCGAPIALIDNNFIKEESYCCEFINLNDIGLDGYSNENLTLDIEPSNNIYIIYTSGTTGNPKGVVLRHENVVNYILWAIKQYVKNGHGNMPLFTSVSFDLTVTSMYLPLLSGNTLIVYDKGSANELIEKVFNDSRIDIIKLTPAHLKISNSLKNFNKNLKCFIVGGEELKGQVARETYYKYDEKADIYNEYGPTEATVGCMIYEYKVTDNNDKGVLIGKAIDNTAIYILDDNMQLRPMGFPGELCVAGAGIASGYLKNSDLTESKFIKSPFKAGEILYKTGDLAIFLPDGNVEYLGRIDNQVKIRGFRIELGEIEKVILKYDGIKEVIVTVIQHGEENEQALAAFYVSDTEINNNELKSFIKKLLPQYMIPLYYKKIDKIPLSYNGKVDSKLLPEVTAENMARSTYETAKNHKQRKLIEIWEKVLCIKGIGIEDDFFELGGHSLKALELMNEINTQLDYEVKIQDIFQYPTIKEFHDKSLTINSKSFTKAIVKEYYDMSSTQKSMFSAWQLDKNAIMYNMPCLFNIEGSSDVNKLEDSFRKLIERYESLRTNFVLINDKLLQKISDKSYFKLEEIHLTENKQLDECELVKKLIKPFNLEEDTLIRGTVIYDNKGSKRLLIDIHHIISDGESNNIYLDDLCKIYNEKTLEPVEFQYKDFSEWSNTLIESKEIEVEKKFWCENLKGEVPILNMPTDFERGVKHFNEREKCSITLEDEIVIKMREVQKEHKLTSFMIMFGTFGILLNKYTKQEEFIIGIPFLGRDLPQFKEITGMLVNTLPVKVITQKDKRVREYFIDIKQRLLQCYSNSNLPFEKIVNLLKVERDSSRNPLFDVMFTMIKDLESNFKMGDALLKSSDIDHSIEKFDMTLQILESLNEMKCQISYSNDLYRKETISSFLNYYKNALKSVLSNWDKPLEEIVILNDKEKAEIRFDKNIEPLDEKQNIIEMFERCVEKNPNKIVLHYKEEKLTYLELNSRVNKLAHYLRENNIKKNDIVGIILDKSIEMIVAILGIIKSGAAYLPIDVANPEERIRYIIKDSNVKYVISKDIYSNYIEEDKYIDVYSHVYANYSDENLEIVNNIHDLAYVIYTSGSTGMPKGALLKHQNVIAIATESRLIDMTEKDKVLQLSNYAFDVSVAEIMCSLLNEAELFVMDKDAVFNINEVAKYIQDNKITFIFTTTAIFNLIVETNIDSLKYIRRISIGGEKASPYHLNKAFKVIGPNKLLNAYGPTETTVIATGYIINELIDEDKKSRVPIGRGLDYLRTYVLSPDNKLEPIGAVGELVIGGLGVAKGYLNKPELTNEKFFQSPFVEGDVLYRTGDLVRLLPDGNIDFLDRIDDQIKIRGYRVEINEIANKIMEHKGVKDVVVVTKTDGNNNNTKLIAYVVLDEEIDVKELKNKLSVELPPYMIPAHFMVIEKIPLTNNGKVDKRNLPEIVEVEKSIDSRPNDDTEALLIEVWSEVLGVDNLSIHDNFFEVGGDSIKAIQVVSKLQKRNKILDVKTIMSIPNIYELSHFVKEKEADFSQEDVEGEILITPIMKEFINEEGRINNHLNQGVILSSENRFNEDNIIKSFDLICRHHDMLRTVWIDGDDKKALYNHNGDAKGYSFEIFNIATNVVDSLERIEKEISKIQKSFDITQLPLFKIALFRCEDEDHLLLIAHHLIIDGISWRIILEDFSEIYMALASEEMVQISKKTSSFKRWAEGLYEYAKSNDINKVIPYWKEILNKNINNKLYKNEFERTLDKVATESVSIDEGTTNKLLHEVNSLYNTETVEILLTALAISFKKTFNNSEFYVNMEGHGREDIQERINVTRTVGWFTSVYPVYLNLSESNTIEKYIIEVKEIMRKIPNKGFDYQILKHISSVKEGEGFNWNQKCQVGFNYLGDYSNTDYGVFTKSNIEITGSFGDDVHQKNPIEINTLIIDGKLKIDISYSKEEISESLMDEFKKEYVNSLKEIIYFCISKDESVFTVSDFDDDSLSEGDLSQILDLFN